MLSFEKRICWMSYIHVGIAQISEEEGRLKKDEEETKEMWKRKREHEEKWEETRDQRVCLQPILCRNFTMLAMPRFLLTRQYEIRSMYSY